MRMERKARDSNDGPVQAADILPSEHGCVNDQGTQVEMCREMVGIFLHFVGVMPALLIVVTGRMMERYANKRAEIRTTVLGNGRSDAAASGALNASASLCRTDGFGL